MFWVRGKGLGVRGYFLVSQGEVRIWSGRSQDLLRVGSVFSFCLFTLVTGPVRSLSLKLSDTRVYEPQIRASQRLVRIQGLAFEFRLWVYRSGLGSWFRVDGYCLGLKFTGQGLR